MSSRVELVLRVVEDKDSPSLTFPCIEVVRVLPGVWEDGVVSFVREVDLGPMVLELSRAIEANVPTVELTQSGRTCFYVDVGDLQPEEALLYVKRMQEMVGLKEDEGLIPIRRAKS